MTESEFDKIVEDTCEAIKLTLIVKGKEYRRNGAVFHNFDVGAQMTGQTREKVLHGFALKHLVSISDMRNDIERGVLPKRGTVEEKFGDAIIYMILEKASVIDRINNFKIGNDVR